jgi:hypothetical protein
LTTPDEQSIIDAQLRDAVARGRMQHRQICWRFQCPDTFKGPYTSDRLSMTLDLCYESHTQPDPREDGIEPWTLHGDHVFGFSSIEQARAWFPDHAIERMEQERFVLTKWVARDVRLGGKQLCFDYVSAKLIATFKPTEIFNLKDM